MDARSDMSPLRLNWWRAEPNFGDAINPLIVGHMSGRPVQHVGARKADLMAIGSMIQVVKRTQKVARDDGSRMVVWGTGTLNPIFGHDFLDNVDVALVRGPITAALLKLKHRLFGDPGLLANEVLPFDGERSERIGIVPHYTMMDDEGLLAFVASDPSHLLIDPRDDPVNVCHAIAGCAHVFAASLHGLVVADSYGVPNTWIEPLGQSWLKYHDYAASIGRSDMSAPIDLAEAGATVGRTITYTEGIAAARGALHHSFPDHLKSGATGATKEKDTTC